MASQDRKNPRQKSARKSAATSASPWRKRIGFIAAGLAVVAVAVAAKFFWPTDNAGAQQPRSSGAAAQSDPYKPIDPVAEVNGEPITRTVLASECIKLFGADVLDSVINKHLIYQHCQATGIQITKQQVEEEVARLARRFNMSVVDWRTMLKDERHISPTQYDNDIIWPQLALRAAASQLLQVSEEELQSHYQSMYGPTVMARIIVCPDAELAKEVHNAAVTNPDEFGKLARQYSVDASAGMEGRLPSPIRRNMGDPEIEQAAFGLAKGGISQIIPIDGQYVILKCEAQVAGTTDTNKLTPELREQLKFDVQSRKQTMAASEVYRKLREQAEIVTVLNTEDPTLEQKYPGVAAVVNGKQIGMQELGEACVERHGADVLEGTISRRVLEQFVIRHQITIESEDIKLEVFRAAEAMGVVDANGEVDIEQWMTMVQREQGLSWQRYKDDVVWPSVALKKLAHKISGEDVNVTDVDLQKAFEANYGPRVRALAIMVNNMRTAQEVWEMARENATKAYFGQLSTQYSVEASLRSLQGEIPPIQMHGGKPTLEEQAFKLQPGEISSIVPVGDYYVILFCEGRTDPANVTMEDVRDGLIRDLYEKKLRVQMARVYQDMMEHSTVRNHLSTTSRAAAQAFDPAVTGAELH